LNGAYDGKEAEPFARGEKRSTDLASSGKNEANVLVRIAGAE
jgi:hypothetical protein